MTLPPPLTALSDLDAQLAASGYAVLDAASLARLARGSVADFEAWRACWDDLPPDKHLRDGGRYRRRRHGCFVIEPGDRGMPQRLRAAPHRAHWQPVEYNALHGGIERWFEPMHAAMTADPAWARLVVALADVATRLRGLPAPAARWFVRRIRSASTPPMASAARRPKARTATGSTWWRCCWSAGVA